MLQALLRFFAGGGATGLAAEFRQAAKDRLDAANDKERLQAEERMQRVAEIVEAQTQGAGSWMAKVVRASYAIPFVLYNAKLIVWDKMLGLGATDPLGPYLEKTGWIVVSFYFVDNSIRFLRRT